MSAPEHVVPRKVGATNAERDRITLAKQLLVGRYLDPWGPPDIVWCHSHTLLRGYKVVLNLYDLLPRRLNGCLSAVGLGGAFHSAVQIAGTEFAFGGHPDDELGITELPRPLFELRREAEEAVRAGRDVEGSAAATLQWLPQLRCRTVLGWWMGPPAEVQQVLWQLRRDEAWSGSEYRLLSRNCNHFARAMCGVLLRHPLFKPAPGCTRPDAMVPPTVTRLSTWLLGLGGCMPCLARKLNAPMPLGPQTLNVFQGQSRRAGRAGAWVDASPCCSRLRTASMPTVSRTSLASTAVGVRSGSCCADGYKLGDGASISAVPTSPAAVALVKGPGSCRTENPVCGLELSGAQGQAAVESGRGKVVGGGDGSGATAVVAPTGAAGASTPGEMEAGATLKAEPTRLSGTYRSIRVDIATPQPEPPSSTTPLQLLCRTVDTTALATDGVGGERLSDHGGGCNHLSHAGLSLTSTCPTPVRLCGQYRGRPSVECAGASSSQTPAATAAVSAATPTSPTSPTVDRGSTVSATLHSSSATAAATTSLSVEGRRPSRSMTSFQLADAAIAAAAATTSPACQRSSSKFMGNSRSGRRVFPDPRVAPPTPDGGGGGGGGSSAVATDAAADAEPAAPAASSGLYDSTGQHHKQGTGPTAGTEGEGAPDAASGDGSPVIAADAVHGAGGGARGEPDIQRGPPPSGPPIESGTVEQGSGNGGGGGIGTARHQRWPSQSIQAVRPSPTSAAYASGAAAGRGGGGGSPAAGLLNSSASWGAGPLQRRETSVSSTSTTGTTCSSRHAPPSARQPNRTADGCLTSGGGSGTHGAVAGSGGVKDKAEVPRPWSVLSGGFVDLLFTGSGGAAKTGTAEPPPGVPNPDTARDGCVGGEVLSAASNVLLAGGAAAATTTADGGEPEAVGGSLWSSGLGAGGRLGSATSVSAAAGPTAATTVSLKARGAHSAGAGGALGTGPRPSCDRTMPVNGGGRGEHAGGGGGGGAACGPAAAATAGATSAAGAGVVAGEAGAIALTGPAAGGVVSPVTAAALFPREGGRGVPLSDRWDALERRPSGRNASWEEPGGAATSSAAGPGGGKRAASSDNQTHPLQPPPLHGVPALPSVRLPPPPVRQQLHGQARGAAGGGAGATRGTGAASSPRAVPAAGL